MPKIDTAKIAAQQIASYPKEFASVISGREKQRIGDAVGLTQFGVNITRIKAGSASALRHWHEQEDEFIYMLEGELVLHENDGETVAVPLLLCVAASNEWPPPDSGKELAALTDRFLFRKEVRPVRTRDGRSRLLWGKDHVPKLSTTATAVV